MEDYNTKLKELGAETLHSRFPEVCNRLDEMFGEEHFSMKLLPQVKDEVASLITAWKDGLREKLAQKKPAVVCEDKVESGRSVRAGTRRKSARTAAVGAKLRKTSASSAVCDDELVKLVCDELERRNAQKVNSKHGKLSKLRQQTADSDSDDSDSEEEMDSNIELKSNHYIVTMMQLLKPEVGQIIEMCGTLTGYVNLHVPKIEDGNNFGVEVQQEILEGIKQVELESTLIQKTLSMYYISRADLVYQLSQLPQVLDFHRALEELDTKQFMTMRMLARDQRNSCYGLLDLINKNIEKVLKPRSASHAHSLVY